MGQQSFLAETLAFIVYHSADCRDSFVFDLVISDTLFKRGHIGQITVVSCNNNLLIEDESILNKSAQQVVKTHFIRNVTLC